MSVTKNVSMYVLMFLSGFFLCILLVFAVPTARVVTYEVLVSSLEKSCRLTKNDYLQGTHQAVTYRYGTPVSVVEWYYATKYKCEGKIERFDDDT